MSRSTIFLPALPLGRRLAPWGQSAFSLGAALAVLVSSAALAARMLPVLADERGQTEIIELALLETTTQSEAREAAADAPEQREEARKHIDEAKAQPSEDDRPQEQASPEAAVEDLRLAQEKTRETAEQADPAQQTTEAQARKDVAAPVSQASLAAEASDAAEGRPVDTTATAPDVGSSRDGERTMLEWQKTLFSHIGRNRFYPPEARRQNLKGEVQVAFALDRDGRISGLRIAASSGSKVLDEAALEVMRRSDPAPRPPAGIAAPLDLALPIRFQLK